MQSHQTVQKINKGRYLQTILLHFTGKTEKVINKVLDVSEKVIYLHPL